MRTSDQAGVGARADLVFMLLDEASAKAMGRPTGITAVARVFVGYATVAAAYAILLWVGRIAMSSGAWLIGGGLEIMGKWIFVLYATLHAVCGAGLWGMRRWALRLGSLLLLWGLIQVTPAISSAVADGRVYAIAREGVQIVCAWSRSATTGWSRRAMHSNTKVLRQSAVEHQSTSKWQQHTLFDEWFAKPFVKMKSQGGSTPLLRPDSLGCRSSLGWVSNTEDLEVRT